MFPMPMVADDWHEPDVILSYLVTTLVNGMGLEIGMTMVVNGLVMSGTLISEKAYLDIMTETLQSQISFDDKKVPEEVQEALADLLDLRPMAEFDPEEIAERMQAVEDMFEVDDEEDDDDDDDFDVDDFDDIPEIPVIHYAHIKDPVMVAGEPPVSFGEGSRVVMRIRLASIDSWMLGRLMSSLDDDFSDFDSGELKH